MAGSVIRDFVYLDWERLRSFVAQAESGVPETRSSTLTSEEADHYNAELGFPGIARIADTGDLRYLRSATETRSLHHAVFAAFEQRLEETNAVLDITPSYSDELWTPENFGKYRFIRVRGVVRVVDYLAILSLLEQFGTLTKLVHIAEKSALQERGLEPAVLQRELQKLEKKQRDQLKTYSNFPQLAAGLRSLFGEGVRLKIVPDLNRPTNLLIGSAARENFDESIRQAIGIRGAATNSGWTALLQLDSSQVADLVALPTGNQMEDALDQVVAQMDQMANLLSGSAWPVLNCIPLAVYRMVQDGPEHDLRGMAPTAIRSEAEA